LHGTDLFIQWPFPFSMPSNSRTDSPSVQAPETAAEPSNERLRSPRMMVFVGVFALILLVSTLFVSVTYRHFTGSGGWAVMLAPSLLTLSFVPATLFSFGHRHFLLRAIYRVAAVALSYLNFALFAALACWIGAAAVALFHLPAFPREMTLGLYGLAVVITIYGLFNAAWIRTTRVTVSLPGLPPIWRGRTLALVSDVHLGNVRGAGFVRRIVSRLNALKPEAVLVAGDMFDGVAVDLATIVQPWKKLDVPLGAFFSTGNHDEFSAREKYLAAMTRAGVRVLHNEKLVLEGGLQLIGIHDGEAGEPARFAGLLRDARIDHAKASILLTHQPSHLSIPEEAGISLQVSGHTHGGQSWPWTHIVSRVHGRFSYGLNRLNSLQVLTSSGVGTWGPPLRVGTRAEIVLITLT
jgi:predicted MPP superfamily phosphohydrolase